MTIERAIEILDPEHREHYDGLAEVNEACRMAICALKLVQSCPPEYCHACGHVVRPGDNYCPVCGKKINKGGKHEN